MAFVFWTSIGLIAYVYAGYPLLLAVWSTCRRLSNPQSALRNPQFPGVSIVIAARNEGPRIAARIENLLSLDYPASRRQIIVVSDGSTDETLDVLFRYQKVAHVISVPAGGKANALNVGVARATNEIVIFADARQVFARDALRELVAPFADPEVGAVSGELLLDAESALFSNRREAKDRRRGHAGQLRSSGIERRIIDRRRSVASTIADGVGMYWRYEKQLRRLESEVGSMLGATGAIYAIRRSLWQPLPAGTLLDDVLTPMRIVLQGFRVVFTDRARAFDRAPVDAEQEARRKVRTLAGNYQLMALEPRLLAIRCRESRDGRRRRTDCARRVHVRDDELRRRRGAVRRRARTARVAVTMERLTFNVGSTSGPAVVAGRARPGRKLEPSRRSTTAAAVPRERLGWDYIWMLSFTALLFFRPQDQIPGLQVLHLAELTAIAGLAAMAVRRLSSGETIAKINAEVVGVLALGAVMVLTMPFSIWPGGSMHVFSDIFVKIILIFALMISTLTSPKRIRQMTWVMIIASTYIAARGVLDYVRGVNLVEGDRLRGAVGGMFQNPNDLALNLVTFLGPTLLIVVQDRKTSRRLLAAGFAAIMLMAIVCTKSRSGFLGLLVMGLVVAYYTVRVRPGIILAAVLAGLLALPAMPSSFWDRMDSITNADEDTTGSRAARLRLINQGLEVFAENPITGIGAGQFQNYNAPGVTVEKWRVTHDVWLQVASELGIFGVLVFAFLVIRAYSACFGTLRLLRPPRRKRGARQDPPPAADTLDLTENERVI